MQREVLSLRPRYNNHLNPSFAKEDWTSEEELLLVQLHNELGNKWAVIAARLGGRYSHLYTARTTE